MSTVSPKIRAQFESMPIDLKNHILSMDVKLENMNDLMAVLERIVAEGGHQVVHVFLLDRALLSPEAIAYFNALPLDAQIALEKSNTSFRSLDDIQDYQQRMLSHVNDVLYKQLPEPAIPSNAALDPLDAD